MTMNQVESSVLSEIGFEANTLVIAFKDGKKYSYTGVPEGLFIDLMNAPSKGAFFQGNIKDRFQTAKV